MMIERLFRYIFTSFIASLFIISCSKAENADCEDHGITFMCNERGTKSATNATLEDLAKAKNGFKLFAHSTFTPELESPSSTSFNRDIYYSNEKGWTYDEPEYWITGATYNFRAYYPADKMVINEEGYGSYEMTYYNVPEKDDQIDLLFASTNKSEAEAALSGYAAVPLQFDHILSKINIKVKVDTDKENPNKPKVGAIIKGVGIGNIASSASFTDGDWKSFYGSTNIGYNLSSPIMIGESHIDENMDIILDNVLGEELFGEDDEFIVIPQRLENNIASIQLYVDIITPPVSTGNGYEYEILQRDQPLICNIPAITWEKSKKYTYIVTITQNFSIQFDEPVIEDWEDSKTSGTIIIR